jgi:type IV pilus biogenesis protein CpaD/CtpE
MRQDMKMQVGTVLVASVLLLGGCAPSVYQDSTTPTVGYGNAVRQNAAVMIIDPQPLSASNVNLDLDGRRAGIAIERYRTGTVIPPRELRTSDVLNGTGSSE